MVDKVTLTDISSFVNDASAAATYNTNLDVITMAFDNTLSRDGTQPNTMLSTLDMNSNRVINLPVPQGLSDAARLQDTLSPTATLLFTPAGSNGDIQYNNNGVVGGGVITYNGNLNFPGISNAVFHGLSSGAVTVGVPAVAGTTTFNLPGSNGTTNQVLITDGSGNTSWVLTPAVGTINTLQYNNGGTLADAAGTTWDNTNSALTITGPTLTTTHPILNLNQTWNNAGAQFVGIQLNVTDTAALSGSAYINITSTSAGNVFSVKNTGATGVLELFNINGQYDLSQSGSGGLYLATGALVGWAPSGVAGPFNFDTSLGRDAAGILSIKQGTTTSPTSLRVYNTFTNSSNYERAVFDWNTTTNVLTIGNQIAGSGVARNISFVSGGTNVFDYGVTNANALNIVTQLLIIGAGGFRQSTPGNNLLLTNSNASIGSVNFNCAQTAFIIELLNSSFIGFSSGFTTNASDTGLARNAAGVLEVNNGTAGTLTGSYLHWGGQARNTSSQNLTTTTFGLVTGLSINVLTGRTYHFEAHIPVTANGSTGGIKVNVAGSTTATNILYDVYSVSNNAITGQQQVTSLGAANTGSLMGAATGFVIVNGTITTSGTGTLTINAAENTASGTTVIGQGATFYVYDNA